jgi:subtilisin family serine protease
MDATVRAVLNGVAAQLGVHAGDTGGGGGAVRLLEPVRELLFDRGGSGGGGRRRQRLQRQRQRRRRLHWLAPPFGDALANSSSSDAGGGKDSPPPRPAGGDTCGWPAHLSACVGARPSTTRTRNPALDLLDSGWRDYLYTFTCLGDGVDVYVIDSGVRRNHGAIAHAVDVGRARNLHPDRGDGGGGGDISDCTGHGTAVASQIAGRGLGPAPNARLVPIRIFECDSKTTNELVLRAVDYALASAAAESAGGPCGGARKAIIQFSSATADRSDALNALAQRAADAGVLWVSAAGNYAKDACDSSPAGSPGSVTVGSVDTVDYGYSTFSSWGPCVAVSAVGRGNVLAGVAADDELVDDWPGTSFAAPVVAGVAAAVWGANPWLTVPQLRGVLTGAASKPGAVIRPSADDFEAALLRGRGGGEGGGGGGSGGAPQASSRLQTTDRVAALTPCTLRLLAGQPRGDGC